MKSTLDKDAKALYIDERILLKFFCYPLAKIISKWLPKSIVRPTHITLIWYLIMFYGAYLGYIGGSTLVVFSVFFLAYFLDCLDGQYARDSGFTSSTGKLLDDFGGDVFEALLWISFCHAAQISNESYPFIADLGYCIGILVLLRGSLGIRLIEMEQKIDSETTTKVSVHNRPKNLKRWVGSLLDFGSLQVPIIFAAILLHIEVVLITIMFSVAALKFLMYFKLAFKMTRTWDEALSSHNIEDDG